MYYLRLVREDGAPELLRVQGKVRLGREIDNDVVLDDYDVSRHHAEFEVRGGRLLVRDLGSRNGTTVERGPGGHAGADVAGQEVLLGGVAPAAPTEAELVPGDVVRVGGLRLRVGDLAGSGEEGVSGPPEPGETDPGVTAIDQALSSFETLDLSAHRAVELLDFVAHFARSMPGSPTRASAALALARLREFAGAADAAIVELGADARTVLLAGSGPGEGATPDALAHAARAVGAGERARPIWVDASGERPPAMALPLADGTCLALTFPEAMTRPATETLRSIEIAGVISGQLLRLASTIDALDRSNRSLVRDRDAWRRSAERADPPQPVVAVSAEMRRALEEALVAAGSVRPVLVTGPTGSGKEVVARYIHQNSARRDGHFVAVNCAALSDELFQSEMFGHRRGAFTGALEDRVGLFELADGGTLFLDEVGELTPFAQARLLRTLDDGRYRRVGEDKERTADVRIVAATNRDLAAEEVQGRAGFRQDLSFRLEVFHIKVPPLAERRDDILPLAQLFLRRSVEGAPGRIPELDVDAARLLQSWDWPGNVRELRNVVDRAVALGRGTVIAASDLRFSPARGRAAATGEDPGAGDGDELARLFALPRDQAIEGFKRAYFERLLRACDWNIARAARVAGMERRNLQQAIARHRLERPARQRD